MHIGAGAFHRAHQAVLTEEAIRLSGDTRWGILAATQRSRVAADELSPQQGLFSVLTVGSEPRLDVVGSICDVVDPAVDTARILAALVAPETQVVTVTVTEQGYPVRPDGSLEAEAEAVRGDLRAMRAEHEGSALGRLPASSMVGLLARGVAARARIAASPLTVLSCDNLHDNGPLLGRLIREAVAAGLSDTAGGADAVLAGVTASVTFPATMVDRITPRPTPQLRKEVADRLGVRDEGAVAAEAFRQWVIEDDFAGDRPPWELAGVQFVAAVSPFEQVKLRLLNGTHSVLAYAGAVHGASTIAEAVVHPIAGALARHYLFDDAVPSTNPPPGVDLHAYAATVLARFAEAALGHTVEQVASDGSLKLPLRWGPVAATGLSQGRVPRATAAATAMWIRFLFERPELLRDPRADELRSLASSSRTPGHLLDVLLDRAVPMPRDVCQDPRFRKAARHTLEELS